MRKGFHTQRGIEAVGTAIQNRRSDIVAGVIYTNTGALPKTISLPRNDWENYVYLSGGLGSFHRDIFLVSLWCFLFLMISLVNLVRFVKAVGGGLTSGFVHYDLAHA